MTEHTCWYRYNLRTTCGCLRRLHHRSVIAALAFALLGTATAAQAGKTVVTNHLVSQDAQTREHVLVTFGQVFREGDMTRGDTLHASVAGQAVALQVDAKAHYPDGSLRHAVLTVDVPRLAGKASLPLTLANGSTSSHPETTVKLAQLLATDYDARASVRIQGVTYTASARAALLAARHAGDCAPWNRHCNQWLSGPLVSEWVVDAALKSADGHEQPALHVRFAVRAYSGTSAHSIGPVRTDIIVENTHAFAPQAQPRYTATLNSGTASYHSPDLLQYAYTRWHKVLWWNRNRPRVYLRQDTRYIQETGAVSRYMDLVPDPKFLAGLRQHCAPLQHCDQTRHMGNSGSQPAIGPLPRWTSVYIIDPDVRAYRWMLANTDALGAYSMHYRDQATGWPVSITRHPYVTIADWASANRRARKKGGTDSAYRADLLSNCVNNDVVHHCTSAWYGTGNPNKWDNAHQPAQAFVPYMVTGDYYYMSEMAFDASMNELWSNESYRGLAKGLIDRGHSQIRGKAWVLREMADAAWLLPDHHPLKQEFRNSVENSLADWNRKYTRNPSASPLHVLDDGVIYRVGKGKRNAVAPWQHNFFTWSVGHAADLGFKGAAELRDWLAVFEVKLMTDWQDNPTRGYCWLQASAYKVQVQNADGAWLPNFTAVYADTFPTLTGLECNSDAMVAATGKRERKHWRKNQMSGHPRSPTGFPANFQIGLAAATDSHVPGAAKAWSLFRSRSVKPTPPHGYNNYPNFAVIPRSVSP